MHDCPSCECDWPEWSEEQLERLRELRTEDSLAGMLFRGYESLVFNLATDPLVSMFDGPATVRVYDVGISGDSVTD